MGYSDKHDVRNKYEKAWLYSIYACIIVAVALITFGLVSLLNFIYVSTHIKEEILTADTDKPAVEYLEVRTIIDNPTEYVGKTLVLSGYLCKEMGVGEGIAWLTDKPERSKDEVETNLIRLENTDPFEFTAEAIAVQGNLHTIEEEDGTYSLVLTESTFYKYDGQNKEMLMHNEIVRADAINAIALALQYGDTETEHEVFHILEELQEIAQEYSNTEFETTVKSIYELSDKKLSLSQEEFEEQAEQLWNQFVNILLDK